MSPRLLLWTIRCGCVAATLPALAHGAVMLASAPDLAELSLEQLANITVTSASRRAERLIDAPASIFVITREDIRRSGAITLVDALRLAPNLHVAAIDNSQVAISSRGFNSTTANKLLVLIDGRTVYTPLFSGVFWDVQDVALEDVARIEVISGPAATLWGSNGVNGVINITTLDAHATQGAFANGWAGNDARGGSVRYGGSLGEGAHFRLYGKYTELDAGRVASGAGAHDEFNRAQAGFRADWSRGEGVSLTFQGDAYKGEGDNVSGLRKFSGSNLLGRWQSRSADGATQQVQAYLDHTERDHRDTFGETLDTFDIEYQHASKRRGAHLWLWGAGYRFGRDHVRNSAALAFLPADSDLRWANAFAQDEIALWPRVVLTLGLKIETNPYTGHEWLPNARLAWQPSDNHLVWTAFSRAVRAPSRLDRELFAPGSPPFTLLTGNDTFMAEVANVAEVGYRAQVTASTSYSLTAFHHRFPNLRSVEPSSPGPMIANGIRGRVTGLEGWGSYRALPNLVLSGGFTLLDQSLAVRPGFVNVGGFAALGNDPKRTALVRASWDISPRHELDVTLRHTGALPDPAVPAHTALDARLGWHVSHSLEVALGVRNAGERYAEFGQPAVRALLERSYYVKLSWKAW
jgi:iron complex outermembrane receptor protein